MAGLTAAGFLPSCGSATIGETFAPEMFGARGDGRTNDTNAFAALSAHVNARGGGTIVLRPVTYLVGKQLWGGPVGDPKDLLAFTPSDILHFVGCSGPIVVQGNGARLRCAPGLRYGAFDPSSGRPLPNSPANLKNRSRASPYLGMIDVEDCSGSIHFSDIELDGNLQGLILGGKYGEGGWQAWACGIRFRRNKGPARLSRIHSHHHAFDGIIFIDDPNRGASTLVSDSTCEFNARTACSITGGRNYAFERCRFQKSGKGGMRSAPACGFDIEAESSPIRNVRFSSCEFSDNSGIGLDAGGGDSEGITFDDCSFIATSKWAAWPDKAGMRFNNCRFVGSLIRIYGDPDPNRAAQFHGCTFSDDPALSPTGQVYVGPRESWPIAFVSRTGAIESDPNVLFSRCRFNLIGRALLPASAPDVVYADCEMSQRSPVQSRPSGTYLGTTTISGNANLAGSIVRGVVILNGKRIGTPR
jgi:hypothetical protein